MKTNIILRAPVFSQSGYGAHGRDIALALWQSQQFNVSIIATAWGTSSATDNLSPHTLEVLKFMCDNVIREGVPFTFIHVGVPTEFQKLGHRNIGVTAGVETDLAPKEWVIPCNAMDAIIVPTEFTKKQLIAIGVTSPIYCVGEGVDTSIFSAREAGSALSPLLPEGLPTFNFLATGQWIGADAFRDRKGIGFLIDWFMQAFDGREDVGLVIKTQMHNMSSPDYAFTRQRIEAVKGARALPKITFLHGDMTDAEIAGIYKDPRIKAFVSTTCGEGWGRGIAHAAAVNLPILATGWSAQTCYLVDGWYAAFKYAMKDIPATAYQQALLYPPMKWALADKDDVIQKMRRCVTGYPTAVDWAEKQGEAFRKLYSSQVTDRLLVDAVASVTNTLPSAGVIVPKSGGITL